MREKGCMEGVKVAAVRVKMGGPVAKSLVAGTAVVAAR